MGRFQIHGTVELRRFIVPEGPERLAGGNTPGI
jgi:hypothetical protein